MKPREEVSEDQVSNQAPPKHESKQSYSEEKLRSISLQQTVLSFRHSKLEIKDSTYEQAHFFLAMDLRKLLSFCPLIA
jgi:hypothetical protein